MAKPVEVETDIRAISSEGAGIGSLPDGRVLFVHRTAPGDRVRVEVTEDRARWARGRLLEILEPSPSRAEPPCPLYETCGGCVLQHLPYPEQLGWKARSIRDALERIGDREVEIPEILPSPDPLAYRGRMTFTLRRLRSGRVVAGLHEMDQPGRIVDIHDECLLPDPQLLEVWARLRDHWGPGARRLPGGGSLRLTLRVAEEGVGLLISGGRSRGDTKALLEAVEGLEAIWLEDRDGARSHAAGAETLTERWLDEEFELQADTFVQVNRRAAEDLQRWVLERARERSPETVVDAYAGVGVYGRALARDGATSFAIESDLFAVRASMSGTPAGFHASRGLVEERLAKALPADLVILNPPRSGLDERVPAVLRDSGTPTIMYVSCDPATLARDLERLGERYEITDIRAMDLFPQTAHVETAVVLERTDTGSSQEEE